MRAVKYGDVKRESTLITGRGPIVTAARHTPFIGCDSLPTRCLPDRSGTVVSEERTVMDTAEAFEILGLPRTATPEEIRAAYLRLSRQVHSDLGGSDGLFRQVKSAYDTLTSADTSQGPYEPRGTWSEWYRGEQRNAGGATAQGSDLSSHLRKWYRTNPSLALLLCGSMTMFLGVHIGVGAILITFLGALAVLLGLAGAMGAKQSHLDGRSKSGAALLRSQLRTGLPRLLKNVGKALLVMLTAVLAIGLAIDHFGKARGGR